VADVAEQSLASPGRRRSAVEAWTALGFERPASVQVLKPSRTFRLPGVGLGGSDVVAKRLDQATDGNLTIEKTIYEQVLPRLPVGQLHYYGCVNGTDDDSCWLFLEDAGSDARRPSTPADRVLTARWLGVLHSQAEPFSKMIQIRDQGATYYLESLRLTRSRLLRNLAAGLSHEEDVALLQTILRWCDALEEQWSEIEGLCLDMPCTVVHGDFVSGNLCIRDRGVGPELVCFDWEHAGLGVPAVDLFTVGAVSAPGQGVAARPDLPAYRDAVAPCWDDLDLEDIRRFSLLGDLFRCIDATTWASEFLPSEWTMDDLRAFSELWPLTLEAVIGARSAR